MKLKPEVAEMVANNSSSADAESAPEATGEGGISGNGDGGSAG